VRERATVRQKDPKRYFAGKTALITGGSDGVGLAIAKGLAGAGCNVVIAGRSQSKLDRAAKSLLAGKSKILTVVCDVREEEQVRSLMREIRREFSRLDILINNAGVAHPSIRVAKLPIAAWRQVIDTNLTGTFLVTQAALPLLKRGSIILNNLSIAAKRAFPGASGYGASKWGALGFTNTLREELRPQGIRVIGLVPGAIDTDLWETFWPDAPRKKMMLPQTVAQAVLQVLALPADSTVEELTVMPKFGTL
jgi:NAD(P)-dependent dehydrogenase (short-subunit alcohol dehydrogenase family)